MISLTKIKVVDIVQLDERKLSQKKIWIDFLIENFIRDSSIKS
jgi:hypothetical protein